MGRKYTIRHATRRKLEGCAKLCDTINQHLADVASAYEEHEKERYEAMLEIGRIVDAARTLMLDLRKNL